MLAKDTTSGWILFADVPRGLARAARGLFWIRKTRRSDLESETLRLAATSPHLLRDIGLRPDDSGRVWSDGRHRIAVPGPEAVDRLLRIGRF